ncbi:MAG: MBOAT family protein [Lachnospiraceae bacterium]|nr:MBOAT family protein [Lachnospiraceae bacterium]
MLFNSYIFIFLFFPLTLIGYYTLNHFKKYKSALAFVIGMSLWFYGYNNIYYLYVLITSIIVNYFITNQMMHFDTPKVRRVFLGFGLFFNIGIFFYFKYFDFFIDNINIIFKTSLPFLRLALPLGISFYTFQQLSYVIDCYRKDCEKYSFLEYAAYVSYFPQLIAGPIVFHTELIPQFRDETKKHLNFDNLCRGIYAFSLGLAKKVLLADIFSKVVTIGYGNISDLNTPSVILVLLCSAMQIYFDFSGYCDMAYGIGYMMNIELPQNFNSPYKSASVTELWNRWHMTLSRFFIHYVYIPLGGSRKGNSRTLFNVFIVFFISGFWHGANWTYILWGALNGAFVILERIFKIPNWKTPKFIKVILTFSFFTFTLSIFRSASVSQAISIWEQLFIGGFGPIYQPLTDSFNKMMEVSFLYRAGLGNLISACPFLPLFLFMSISVLGCMTLKNTQEKTASLKLTYHKLAVVVILLFWSIMSLSEISEFLYFNF